LEALAAGVYVCVFVAVDLVWRLIGPASTDKERKKKKEGGYMYIVRILLVVSCNVMSLCETITLLLLLLQGGGDGIPPSRAVA